MKRKLFGNNIKPNCTYCEHYMFDNQLSFCAKKKVMKKDKCRSFKYDPLMRAPKTTSFIQTYTAEDFKL